MKTLGCVMTLLLFTTGCGYINGKEGLRVPGASRGRSGFDGSPLTFEFAKSNIFDSKCATCHKFMTDYTRTKSKLDVIADRILRDDDKMMPPIEEPQLTAEEKEYVLQWIEAGAPEK